LVNTRRKLWLGNETELFLSKIFVILYTYEQGLMRYTNVSGYEI